MQGAELFEHAQSNSWQAHAASPYRPQQHSKTHRVEKQNPWQKLNTFSGVASLNIWSCLWSAYLLPNAMNVNLGCQKADSPNQTYSWLDGNLWWGPPLTWVVGCKKGGSFPPTLEVEGIKSVLCICSCVSALTENIFDPELLSVSCRILKKRQHAEGRIKVQAFSFLAVLHFFPGWISSSIRHIEPP